MEGLRFVRHKQELGTLFGGFWMGGFREMNSSINSREIILANRVAVLGRLVLAVSALIAALLVPIE
jgi:hypothetical protein